MTVAELITKLQAVGDPTLRVYVDPLASIPPREIEDIEVERHHSEPDGPYIVVLS